MMGESDRSRGATLERLGLTALAYPAYVTFLSANLVSNASWFIFGGALNTYILQVTGSAQTVGVASFIYSLPFALFMLHAGLLVDRVGARRLVAISLAASGIVIVLTGLLALSGWPLWVLIALGFIMAGFQTLGAPSFISIVNDLVPPRAVSSGVALTFLGFNFGRILGGVVGGILLVSLSSDIAIAAPLTIIVAGLMQGVPSIPIWRLKITENLTRSSDRAMLRPLVEAASYARHNPTLGAIILLAIAPGAIGLSYMFLLPVVVRDIGADPGAIGLMYVAGGIGGLLSGLFAEPIMRRAGHGRAMFLGIATVSIGLIGVGVVGTLALTALAVGIAQAGFAVYGSSALSLIQALAPPRLRGRVTSLFTLLYWGLLPFGALIGGLVAERSSALFAVGMSGVLILLAGLAVLIGRRQIATLRIARDGSGVTGRLEGSGYPPRA